ncbi:MAG: hypothetical protein LUD12_11370 [Lachnospiraceae bacterium]|nr:hypothetical protein [Lachnospiraceae bacterium]
MNQLKKYCINLRKNNEERIWREINDADERWPEKHPLQRFIIASNLSNYMPDDIPELQIFRYKYMTGLYQMKLSYSTLKKKTIAVIRENSEELSNIAETYDLGWCKSVAYQPQQYCDIRNSLVNLLEGVGSSYWVYYKRFLCARGYQYSTPMTDLAYVCEDLSRELVKPLESMANIAPKIAKGLPSYLNKLKTGLQNLSKMLVRLDDYAVSNYLEQDFLKNMQKIHDSAVSYQNMDCLYELDKLYATMVCTYIISGSLEGKIDGIILNDKWRVSAERENTESYLREMLDLSQACISDAMPKVKQYMLKTWM